MFACASLSDCCRVLFDRTSASYLPRSHVHLGSFPLCSSLASSQPRLPIPTHRPSIRSHPAKMFRTALLRSARSAICAAPRCQASIARPARAFVQPKQITPAVYFQSVRGYAASAGLSKDEVEGRIMDLLKNFDKVRRCAVAMQVAHSEANGCTGPGCLQGSYQLIHWVEEDAYLRALAQRRGSLPQRPRS